MTPVDRRLDRGDRLRNGSSMGRTGVVMEPMLNKL